MTKSCRKLCVGPAPNAVADDEAEQVGADDAEDTANDRADQPLQADLSQPNLKQNDGTTNQDTNCGGRPTS